jgi:hypothetical protein
MMGAKFLTYSASSNNCQYFIRAVFSATGMLRPQYEQFIKQDTESIFRGNPALRKFANTVTDIAGEVNGIVSGGDMYDSDTELHCLCCDKMVLYKNKDTHNQTKMHMKKKQAYLKNQN